MAVIMVNWDDENELSVAYDPVKLGAAESETDNCTYEDVYGRFETFTTKGEPWTFEGIKMHGHSAFYVKCLPW